MISSVYDHCNIILYSYKARINKSREVKNRARIKILSLFLSCSLEILRNNIFLRRRGKKFVVSRRNLYFKIFHITKYEHSRVSIYVAIEEKFYAQPL